MIDETTLSQTLAELASDLPLVTAPGADAKRRARALQRRRRTAAAGAVVVLAGGTFAVVHVAKGTDSTAPGSGRSSQSHGFGFFLEVYWQGPHLCTKVNSVSACSTVAANPKQAITVANIDSSLRGEIFASVGTGVTSVKVSRPDGSSTVVQAVPSEGLPYVVVEGKVVSLRGLDSNGKQVGDAVAGPDALQLRPVVDTQPCSENPKPTQLLELPSDEDPTQCFGLGPVAMTTLPQAADAVDDPTQGGWVVQLTFTAKDTSTFASLTDRLSRQPAPMNQLAFVLDGKVLTAPSILSEIGGGQAVISGDSAAASGKTAEALAAQIRG